MTACGGFPARVHVVEDFETDGERRWWLCGKPETRNVAPGSNRACRGVFANDFDDRASDPGSFYQAVVFRPVPAPALGPAPRLGFRCWLKGDDTLRVQVHSLTRGYHRNLRLAGLPQKQWLAITVDLAQTRRPDGSGGPLGAQERIGDLQFYTDGDAELIIDDIVLYEAASAAEKRPFPEGLSFARRFDSRGQGDRPQDAYERVPKAAPQTGTAARAVTSANADGPWIRLSLGGRRRLSEAAQLRFRYHLVGSPRIEVALFEGERKLGAVTAEGLSQAVWNEATIALAAGVRREAVNVDELRFLLPSGAELLIDDLLLFEYNEPPAALKSLRP